MRWAIEDGWTLTQRYLAQLARRPARLAGVVAFPLLMVLIFAYLLGGGMSVPGGGSYREFLMPGMFAMTMAFGLSGTMIAVVDDTGKGVTDRFRSLPMAPSAVFTGRVAADLVNASLALAVLVGCGLAVGWRPHGGVGETLAALGLLLLLRTALVWVGIYLGLLTSDPSMVTLAQTLEFPFGFLSGAFVATSTMPVWLGTVAEWNPLSSTVTAARVLFGNPGAAGTSWVSAHAVPMAVVWPLVLLAVFVPLSVRRYRRLGN
ncbi:ABC transporter permease [Amycolatopsis sp.]|uniref:ABC transporter permease n=1 Tax=Amycolatopsis sp. TaxID=37632 RepID=UPI002D80CB0C|nr:ABC transporter permease [Amycolatopsis sp.]HET6705507.1 ABC transporter permease [Amycolatopsis sp.]